MDSVFGLHVEYDKYLFCPECECVQTGIIRLNSGLKYCSMKVILLSLLSSALIRYRDWQYTFSNRTGNSLVNFHFWQTTEDELFAHTRICMVIQGVAWLIVFLSIVFNALSAIFQHFMATSFSGGRSRSTRREPPTMGKQLVTFITYGYESSATFFVTYKAGREPRPYWW